MDKIQSASGIARSLTTRMNRKASVTQGNGTNGGALGRAFSMRKPEKQTPRPEISLPIELVSATNPLAFSAPDLPQHAPAASPVSNQLTAVSSTTSLRSENSTPALSSASSATFTFSGISTPTDELPEPRLISLREAEAGVPASPQSLKSVASSKKSAAADASLPSPAAPAVPKRAPSHTKRTHQVLARQRSMSRMRSETTTSASSSSAPTRDNMDRHSGQSSKEPIVARSSADMFSAGSHTNHASVDADHPFGAELAKLTEVVEEFSSHRGQAAGRSRSRTPEPTGRSSSRPSMPPTPKARVPMPSARKQRPAIDPTVWDEETEYLSRHGLQTFSAEEYMAEIGSPYAGTFPLSAY